MKYSLGKDEGGRCIVVVEGRSVYVEDKVWELLLELSMERDYWKEKGEGGLVEQ